MAKISFYLDRRAKSPVVKLLVSSGSKSQMLTLGVKLDSPEQWDVDAKDGPVVGMDGAKAINALLRARLRVAKEVMAQCMQDGVDDVGGIVSAIRHRINPEEVVRTGELAKVWSEFVNNKTGRTWQLYHETRLRVERFINDVCAKPFAQMDFADITLQWIERFDVWMSRSRGVNARAIDLRNLRAVCMYAWKMDITPIYVWKRYHIKREEAEQVQTLTDEQFRQLMTYNIDNRPDLQLYRDVALLGLYLIGINIVDMHALTRIDADGYIRYTRAKTHRKYCIKVEPEALALINKYRGEDRLLAWADRYKTHQSFCQHLNEEGLQRIGPCEVVNIPGSYHSRQTITYHPIVPDITYYWLRRYWATTAYHIGISEDTIALALGHGRKRVTDVYIRKDQELIDKANRQVIDYINRLISQ